MTNTTTDEITHRTVWGLAAPIMLSNISVPMVGAVDTAVMGHLDGPEYIGAVALGALVFSFLYWGFGFLRMGTTGFVARAHGRGDSREVHDTLLRAMLLGLAFGSLVVIFKVPLDRLAFGILAGSDAVESLASQYVSIRIFSAPATLCIYAMTGALIGLQDTRGALYLQLVLNLTNVALDFLFVPVLELGVTGVAMASLIAEYSAVVFGIYLLKDQLRAHPFDWSRLSDTKALGVLMRANFDIFIRTLCLVFSFSYFTALGARFGDAILAANAVLMTFVNITAYALDGFAHAVEALGGSAFGAGRVERFKNAVKRSTQWAGLTAIIAVLGYWLFGDQLIALLTNQATVQNDAAEYLPWLVVAPIISVWSFQLDGIFIGTSQTAQMRNAMLLSTIGYLLILQFTVPAFGNHGLWLGLMLFMVLRAITLGAYYPKILVSLEHRGE